MREQKSFRGLFLLGRAGDRNLSLKGFFARRQAVRFKSSLVPRCGLFTSILHANANSAFKSLKNRKLSPYDYFNASDSQIEILKRFVKML
jgi:hypothetical protein